MNRINMLRKHDEDNQFRKTRMVGHCEPLIHEREGGKWNLFHMDFPPADHVWFVCAPNGEPFPHSHGYTKSGAITGFLGLMNLPRGRDKYGRETRHTDEPERGKWWSWFKGQGYVVQNFLVNPDHKVQVGLRETLKYELKWANERSDGCIWCRGTTRFQNIARRLAVMIDAIDYYSERPKEQERWLATMNKLWNARGRR